ncbi:hypothetical protein ACFVUS_11365 [Nocardia sp. NPDC058058]|uniref:hypothetical protein n=1 Tax=Nocardia sp. NPDC058058 TaxID=3346317 RepID=UPI0036DB236E
MTHRDERSFDTEPPIVEEVSLDAETLALCTLTDFGHYDAHLLRTSASGRQSVERWAREIMEEVAPDVGAALRQGWRRIALQLAPAGSEGTIAGWPIARSSPEYLLLQAESTRGFEGQLLFRCDETGVLLATFVRFIDPAARAIWERVLPAHLEFVRSLLTTRADGLTILAPEGLPGAVLSWPSTM